MPQNRSVFIVSDHTGLTAEALSRSLLAQFTDIKMTTITRPFITTPEAAQKVVQEIEAAAQRKRPLVFMTIINPEIASIIQQADALQINPLDGFLNRLAEELGQEPRRWVGHVHGLNDMEELERYQQRIDALEFALSTDDGIGDNRYSQADVILVGVSRVGKTPTSIYLALQHSLKAANYPFTDEDFDSPQLPVNLRSYKQKIYGLTINAQRLHEIRQIRRANSRYASADTCQREVRWAEKLYARERIPMLDTTSSSVEEIATALMVMYKSKR